MTGNFHPSVFPSENRISSPNNWSRARVIPVTRQMRRRISSSWRGRLPCVTCRNGHNHFPDSALSATTRHRTSVLICPGPSVPHRISFRPIPRIKVRLGTLFVHSGCTTVRAIRLHTRTLQCPAVHLVFKANGFRENLKLQPMRLSPTLRNHRHGFIRVRALLRIGAKRSHNIVVGLTRQHVGVEVRSPRF